MCHYLVRDRPLPVINNQSETLSSRASIRSKVLFHVFINIYLILLILKPKRAIFTIPNFLHQQTCIIFRE